jgi:transcription factor A
VSVEEKLGFPSRPKKPLTPYFRFLSENRARISKENPQLKPLEVVVQCAKEYKQIDVDKLAKYTAEFNNEQQSYVQKLAEYNSKLTEEQRREIAAYKEVKAERKERIEHKKV